jgi:hypothetical protein
VPSPGRAIQLSIPECANVSAVLAACVHASSECCPFEQALEKALLAFHTTKMTDINKTIKELWQKTYRNQDIDYIQARSRMNCGSWQSRGI